MRWLRRLSMLMVALMSGPLLMAACGNVNLGQDWRTADRSSTGLAPDPATTPEAVVQVYAARAFNWRGLFAVHTWVATKRAGADEYVVHQVVGWRHSTTNPVVRSYADVPDRSWYGATPKVIAELRGAAAEGAIDAIERAVLTYPHAFEYTLWPGPNSNTFVAYLTRQVPELGADLPPTAIGKDYLPHGDLVGHPPSGRGVQVSLWGLLGFIVGPEEGVEVNLLGLGFGVDPLGPALRLPGVGRLGFDLDASSAG